MSHTSHNVRENASADHSLTRGRMAIPDGVWAPVAVTFLLAVPGVVGFLLGQPWLFPSLGPTAFLQAETPHLRSARFYNVLVGHLIGMAAGFLAVIALHADDAPPVMTSHILSAVRLEAALLAVFVTMVGTSLAGASHPPASATTLLIALGGMKATAREAAIIFVGLLTLAVIGEGVRQLRLRVMPSSSQGQAICR